MVYVFIFSIIGLMRSDMEIAFYLSNHKISKSNHIFGIFGRLKAENVFNSQVSLTFHLLWRRGQRMEHQKGRQV